MWLRIKQEVTAHWAVSAIIDKVVFFAALAFLVIDVFTGRWIGAAIDAVIVGYVVWSVTA